MKYLPKLENQEKLKVVLDTNIIISSAISKNGNPAKIFELLLLEKIENYTTKEIIKEIETVFNRERIRKLITLTDKEFIINTYKTFSVLISPDKKHKIVKEDKDDDKFIDCAIKAKAHYIISGDPHLTNLKEYKGIKIIKPSEFIHHLEINLF